MILVGGSLITSVLFLLRSIILAERKYVGKQTYFCCISAPSYLPSQSSRTRPVMWTSWSSWILRWGLGLGPSCLFSKKLVLSAINLRTINLWSLWSTIPNKSGKTDGSLVKFTFPMLVGWEFSWESMAKKTWLQVGSCEFSSSATMGCWPRRGFRRLGAAPDS